MGGSRNLAGLRHGRGGSLIVAADKGWRVAVADLTARYSLSPSFILDVSSVWERRMAAVRAYESQFMAGQQTATTALSRPGFLRALEARAVWFGWMIGANYGEPFLTATPMARGTMPGLPPRDDFPQA